MLSYIVKNSSYKYEELFEYSIGWLKVVYKNLQSISPSETNYTYSKPASEQIPTTNIDLTNKENFDVRKLEALGFGFKRVN